MTKTKMKVTPEQSKTIQEIFFGENIFWHDGSKHYKEVSYICTDTTNKCLFTFENLIDFEKYPVEETDADRFIRTIKAIKESKQEDRYSEAIANCLRALEDFNNVLLRKKTEELENKFNDTNEANICTLDKEKELYKLLDEKDTIIKYLEDKLNKNRSIE